MIETLPEVVEGGDKDAELVVGELTLDCLAVEDVVAVGESEGTGAAEVVGGSATEVGVVGVSPQSQDITNRPTPVGSKNSKRP